MISVLLRVAEPEQDVLLAQLMDLGMLGAIEEPGGVRVFFENASVLEANAGLFARYTPEARTEEAIDWQRETENAWPPIEVGERFWLAPDWNHDSPPDGRLRLTIHPGMACGTGAAPATQLALQMLERWVAAASSVLDVGTGTGILADAATLLGASAVFACDIDVAATCIARANVSGRVALFTGSVRSVRTASVDLVVANLNAATLDAVSADMRRVVRPGGALIVSGFRQYEAQTVAAKFGGAVRGRLDDSGWSALVL